MFGFFSGDFKVLAHRQVGEDAIVSALASAGNNRTAAAALLGIHRTHLYKKMKKYGI